MVVLVLATPEPEIIEEKRQGVNRMRSMCNGIRKYPSAFLLVYFSRVFLYFTPQNEFGSQLFFGF